MEDASFWNKLFQDANLPAQTAKKYAALFVENRMTLQLLRFLDKDLLKEIGISAVGDIIAILQHLKTLDFEKLSETTNSTSVTSTTPPISKPIIPPGHELPVPLKRRVSKQIEGSYKVKLPEGKTEKTRKILQKIVPAVTQAPTRTVIITAASSSSTMTNQDAKQPLTNSVDALSDDDSDEDFEVTISSSNPDVRNASSRRLGGSVYPMPVSNSPGYSVFDRLGADPPLAQTNSSKRTPSNGTSVVDRTLIRQNRIPGFSNNGADRIGGLKRSASDSVFSRLGGGFGNTKQPRLSADNSHGGHEHPNPSTLPYRGVFKENRLVPGSVPMQPPRVAAAVVMHTRRPATTPTSSRSPAAPSLTRVSAKARLGFGRTQSAGVLTGTRRPKSVHERLGAFRDK